MPLQYLHTSARRGLEPGKSGFCCVARDRDLLPDLAKELERLSRYEHFSDRENPRIARHLRISLRSGDYHVLSRIIDAGADYSKRNNHIAHHLAFLEEEVVRLPDPATLLLFWNGWKDSWKEPPRILAEQDAFSIQDLDTDAPSNSDAFNTAVEGGRPAEKAYTIEVGWERELALHYRNDLLKLPADFRWNISFTNFILTSDRPGDFMWRGNWKNRPLPFEFESAQSPRIEKAPTTFRKPTTKAENGNPTGELKTRPFVQSAPKVEIPQELRPEDRKRPKQKWTHKRLKRILNLSLAVLALLCGGIACYLLLDLNDSEDSPLPASLEAGGTRPSPFEPQEIQSGAGNRWMSLVASGSIYDNLDEAQALGEILAGAGDKEPLLIAQSLAAIKNGLEKSQALVPLPGGIVMPGEFQYQLNPTVASAMPAFTSALVPSSLSDIALLSASGTPALQSFLQRLAPDRFIPEDNILGLKSARRQVRDQLAQQGLGAVAAAEEFQQQLPQLTQDDLSREIQALESAFGLESNKGFAAISALGILATPDDTDIKNHLQSLYEGYMLPRASSMGSSPEYKQALANASQSHESAVAAARAINEVFRTANPLSNEDRSRLQTIQTLWRSTFLRGDLMKETIINFNLERLANSKRSLARLQSEFQPETLLELQRAQRFNQAIDSAERALENLAPPTTWLLVNLDTNSP